MLNNGKPEVDLLMSFGKRGFGGGGQNFSGNVNNAKIMLYFMVPICCIIGVFSALLGTTSRQLSCLYKWEKAAYDCQITSANILRGNEVKDFNNIQKAVSDFRNHNGSTIYQVQLLDTKDNKLAYNNSWTGSSSSVNKEVENLNKYFANKENFFYDFGIDWMMIFLSVPFILFPIIVLVIFKYFTNNYIFQEVTPGRYKAALKIKDIGKMKLSQDQINEILYQVQGAKGGAPSNSFADKDREFIDRDVEDATKQFYDDGK